jgi:hypothetical protein
MATNEMSKEDSFYDSQESERERERGGKNKRFFG